MKSLVVILSSFWHLGGASVTTNGHVFTDISLHDKVFADNLTFESYARSPLDCARLCGQEESCVTFTFDQNTCRRHGVLMTSKSTSTPSPETVSYARKTDLWCQKTGVKRLTDASLGLDKDVQCQDDWMVIQKRQDGSVDFYRNWQNYTTGFGDVLGEHWLGLETLHLITTSGVTYDLRVDLMKFDGTTGSAFYSNFSVGPAADNYRLHYGSFRSGTAGDGMPNQNDMQFSTWDADNDDTIYSNSAELKHGAWWYFIGVQASLNGDYKADGSSTAWNGILWTPFSSVYSLKACQVMIKPVN